tara:strand:- start:2126 stop:2449 length:324 start_codon:yes stop_codon:yes gene_type:complete
MRLLFFFSTILFICTACARKQNLNVPQQSQPKEQLEFADPKGFEAIEIDEQLKNIKNDLQNLDLDKDSAGKLIKNIEKSALQLVDECIDSKKDQGLPIYECSKLLKP